MEPWTVMKRFGGNGITNYFNLVPGLSDAGYFRIRAGNGNVLQLLE